MGRRDIGHPAPRTAPFEVHPASAVLGAEIVGVDLAPTVDDVTAENLREALWTHKVLVFRDQHLAPDAHVRAVEIFDHPQWLYRHQDNRLVYVFELDKPGAAAAWHVGGTWRNPPFELESLTYQVVPEIGGRTLWANLQAAYDGLSEPVKGLLESVSAVYSAYPGDGTYNRPPVTETIEHPVSPHWPQGHLPQLVRAPADRRPPGRGRGPAAVPASACILTQLHGQFRLEARDFVIRDGHYAAMWRQREGKPTTHGGEFARTPQ